MGQVSSFVWQSLCRSWMCSSFRTFSRVWGAENTRSHTLRLSLQHSSGPAARECQGPSAHREQVLGADSSSVVPQRSACCGPVSRGTREPALQAGQPGSPQLTQHWRAPGFLVCSSQFVGPGGATGEGGAITGVQPCPQLPFPSLSSAWRWIQVHLGLGGRGSWAQGAGPTETQGSLVGTTGTVLRDKQECSLQEQLCPFCIVVGGSPSNGGDTGDIATERGEGQPHIQWPLADSSVGRGVHVKFGVSLNPLDPPPLPLPLQGLEMVHFPPLLLYWGVQMQ